MALSGLDLRRLATLFRPGYGGLQRHDELGRSTHLSYPFYFGCADRVTDGMDVLVDGPQPLIRWNHVDETVVCIARRAASTTRVGIVEDMEWKQMVVGRQSICVIGRMLLLPPWLLLDAVDGCGHIHSPGLEFFIGLVKEGSSRSS